MYVLTTNLLHNNGTSDEYDIFPIFTDYIT